MTAKRSGDSGRGKRKSPVKYRGNPGDPLATVTPLPRPVQLSLISDARPWAGHAELERSIAGRPDCRCGHRSSAHALGDYCGVERCWCRTYVPITGE